MSCFTQPVQNVTNTKIFAKSGKGGRQFLAYQMQIAAAADLAMILPLPTPPKCQEGDVRFLNFEGYPDFFDAMEKAFPQPKAAGTDSTTVKPKDVGAFEAVFIPTLEDFQRQEERFRPPPAWAMLPQYREFSFVLFKLKKGESRIHPMVFDFPRRKPKEIFFPTFQFHAGKNAEAATTDFWLYAQVSPGDRASVMTWRESRRPAKSYLDVSKVQGLIDPDAHIYTRSILAGDPNLDTILS